MSIETERAAVLNPNMVDPLVGFDWPALYDRYDALCTRFNPQVEYLKGFSPRPSSERELYAHLLVRFSEELRSPHGLKFETYVGLLYWKLYSQPAALATCCKRLSSEPLRSSAVEALRRVSEQVPANLARNADEITTLVKSLGNGDLHGMKSGTALPVRTTFLHFVAPDIVPIFDKQVLLAVGVTKDDANHSLETLRAYLPHAWELASRYYGLHQCSQHETGLRVVDLAMWVIRGGCRLNKRN